MLAKLFKLILGKLGDLAFSKLAEKTTDKALCDFNNIKDFQLILKTLHGNLKSLSAKAADVEEEVKNAELSGRKKRKREVEEWLEQVESIKQEVVELGSEVESQGLVKRLIDGGRAEQLNEHVDKLVQQRLNLGELLLDVHGTKGEILVTNVMVGKAVNKDLEGILELLENGQALSIGIYGMGGIGKTTLAKYIHNRLLKKSQGHVFWITVSQEFTIKSLQDKIARCIHLDLSNEDEEAIRAGRLNRFLCQMNNSVLILDDVWENIDMKEVGCTFSLEGCRLIITTRSSEVCHRIGCKKLIQVEKLGKDDAWKLFNQTLENETQLDPQVEEIAKSMAEKCDGLPLGIITVAGSMKGGKPIYAWKDALVELQDCVGGRQNDIGEFKEVHRVLKYSFDQLKRNDERASNCFLYCSLYPEDCEIDRVDLVKNFISEGLLDERRSRRARVEQGHSILDKLVDVCLLESCVVPISNKEGVKMHDLVRSMALQICKGKYMVRAGERSLKEITYDEKEWTKDVEKVSFMGCDISRIREGISPDCPRLSTLLFRLNIWLKFIPNSFFSKMQGLCTLDLRENWNIVMLPNSVSDLTSLKALLLEGCRKLEIVPNLGKLKELKELNLSGTAIKEVPQGLEESRNLRFLSMNADGLKMLPRGLLLNHEYLQHLNLPLHIQVEIEEIESLKQLEEFGGGLKSLSGFNRFIRTCEVCCYSIGVKATAHTFGVHDEMERDMGGTNNQMVLCFSNLKDEIVCGQGIVYLTISECEGLSKCFVDDLAPRFDNPTSLRKLTICRCEGIECILRSDGQFSNTVEEIDLRYLDDVKEGLVVMERGEIGASTTRQQPVFSALRKLTILGCDKLRKIGSPISGFPNLERIEIESCGEIQEIFENEGRNPITALSKFKGLSLKHLPRLRKVGLHMQKIPKLRSISIRDCGEIEEIFEKDGGREPLTTLSKLQYLRLEDCKKMRKAGLTISTVPNLASIMIKNCEEIEEIFEDEGRDPLTTLSLSKLRDLKLEALPRLRKVGLTLSRFPNIEYIIIKSCGEIEEIFEEDEGRDPITTLSKLRVLELEECKKMKKVGLPVSGVPNLERIQIANCEEIEEIFEDEGRDPLTTLSLSKFRDLKLEGLPRLRKVGLTLSRFPNIEHIHIRSGGEIEEIFEEDEGIAASILTTLALPKLKELTLDDLPRLKSVSKAPIISNSIQFIWIVKCPRLMKKFPLHFGVPTPPPSPSLRYICVERKWWESLEWDFNPTLPRLLQHFVEFQD